MSRGDGFPVADVDSSYMDDAKLRALWQRLRDPDRMARAVVLHSSTFLASWRHGERVTVVESAPVWLHPDEDLVAVLVACHLLDRTGRIPQSSWRDWFGKANDARAKARDRWARYNAKRDAVTASEPRGSDAGTATPGPTGPTVPIDTPQPPSRGGRRANRTNPRAIDEARAAKEQREAKRRAQLVVAHNHGAHADDPHPDCRYCIERAATA